MKVFFVRGMVLLLLSSFWFMACDNDKNDPITLIYSTDSEKKIVVQNNAVELFYPVSDTTELIIYGGDGNYRIHTSDTTKLRVQHEQNGLKIFPLAVGNVEVTISDSSGNHYNLLVNISYFEESYIISGHDVFIQGKMLSPNEKEEIKIAALLTIPVQPGGGYKFIYTDENHPGGILHIYPLEFNGEYIEGSFEHTLITSEPDTTYRIYNIVLENEERTFILNPYIKPVDDCLKRQVEEVLYCFKENLTGFFYRIIRMGQEYILTRL